MSADGPELRRSLIGYRAASVRQILADRETMFHLVHERAEQAEARVQALRLELDSARAELTAQAETADAMLTHANAELGVARVALDEHTRQLAVLDARVRESQAELAMARQAIEDQADPRRELAEKQVELEATRTRLREQTEEAGSAEVRTAYLQSQLDAARAELAEIRGSQGASIPEAEELSSILDATERGVGHIVERARHTYEGQLAQAERMREAAQFEIERFEDLQRHLEPLVRSVQRSIKTAGERIDRVPDQIRESIGSMTEALASVSDSLDQLITLPYRLSPGAGIGAETTVIPINAAEPNSRDPRTVPTEAPDHEGPTEVESPVDRSEVADARDHPEEIRHLRRLGP
jgi:chromosome segregation ATPase